MQFKTMICFTLAVACACSLSAQSRRRGPVGADGGAAVAKGRDAYVTIDAPARPGGTCLASAPNLNANGKLMPKGDASRAQVAAIFHRFVENVAKTAK